MDRRTLLLATVPLDDWRKYTALAPLDPSGATVRAAKRMSCRSPPRARSRSWPTTWCKEPTTAAAGQTKWTQRPPLWPRCTSVFRSSLSPAMARRSPHCPRS
eukprot:scaffold1699_cov114-Isochrysis_galbana.AAC.9